MRFLNLNFAAVMAVMSIVLLQGCATHAQKSAGMRQLLLQGRPDMALMEVEKESGSDEVLVNMNRGILRRMNGDYEGSNQALEAAKNKIEELYGASVTEQAGAVIVNDEAISFDGDRYEQVLVHAYKALNYIAMGDMDAARVEILQSDVKMREWGETPEEDPFMRYLSGIIFEVLGEKDDALVAYRKAVDVYQNTKDRHGLNVPAQLKEDLLRLLADARLWNEYKQYQRDFGMTNWKAPSTKGMGELVVLMHNGLTPQRSEKAFQTWSSELALNIRIAVPDYPNPPAYVNQVKLRVGSQSQLLETVENIDGLARASLEADMPIITTRAIARAVVKKSAEKEAGDRGGLFGQLAMMVVNTATEIADTRCWNTLPQEIQLGRMMLPAGIHEVHMDVIGMGGAVVDSYSIPVTIKAGRKTIVSEHWTAPRPVVQPQAALDGTQSVSVVN
ncbi:MAG: hypothetical protein EP315_06060 [Gammaproteobacteria bacterium]|nr:MAG: hypothetical protein EP315_06060 [Gammaproteobacteria bacterium]